MTGIWTMGWVSWFHAWKRRCWTPERHRQERAVQLTEALHRLVSQLLGMSVPAELRKPLKRFAKDLDQRATRLRELPLLLGELSVLQGQVLNLQGLSAPQQSGFLKRLFGGGTANRRPRSRRRFQRRRRPQRSRSKQRRSSSVRRPSPPP